MAFQNGGAPPSFSLRPDTPFPLQGEQPARMLPDTKGSTASPMTNELLIAARKGYSKEIERIIQEKNTLAITTVDRHGRNCLHIASHYGHMSSVFVILGMNLLDINCTSKRGFTPLHEACSEGHLEIVLLLLAMGAYCKSRSKEGWTPLMSACYNGHHKVAKILIAYGLDINAANVHGFTALHIAAWKGSVTTVELLIKEGALLPKETQNGKTALDIAKEENRHEVVTVLKAASVRESEMPLHRIAALEGQIQDFQENLKQIYAQHNEELAKEREEHDQTKQQLLNQLTEANKKVAESLKSLKKAEGSKEVDESSEQFSSAPKIQLTQETPPKNKKILKPSNNHLKLHRGSVDAILSPRILHTNRKNQTPQETVNILGLDSGSEEKKPLSDEIPKRRSLDGIRGGMQKPSDKFTITQLVEESINKPGSMSAIKMELKADGLTPRINKKFNRELPSLTDSLKNESATSSACMIDTSEETMNIN